MQNKTNQTASSLSIVLKCADGAFSHAESCFKSCQADYENGTLKPSALKRLADYMYVMFDMLEQSMWALDIRTGNTAYQIAPYQHPFEAISPAFLVLRETFNTCQQADKSGALTKTNLCSLLEAVERVQAVFYDLEDDDKGTSPDFGHRLWLFSNPADVTGMTDTVTLNSNKAFAVLTMLESMFAEEEGQRLNYDTIYYALITIRHELADIKSIVEAFHLASVKEPQTA